ncbi:hypothetical protein ACIXNL_20130 [Bacteroides fragilis]
MDTDIKESTSVGRKYLKILLAIFFGLFLLSATLSVENSVERTSFRYFLVSSCRGGEA